MSNAWSIYIIVLVLINIVGVVWLLLATAKKLPIDDDKTATTGHEWDGLTELNMPLPRWWIYLFVITILFSVAYLILYPGMGNFAGTLGWSQQKQYTEESITLEEKYAATFAQFNNLPIEELINNQQAMNVAQSLYANNCSTCHGADARGAPGFPNLADNDWLYGGEFAQIKQSIALGRSGAMPAMGAAINGESGAYNIAVYVRSFTNPIGDEQSRTSGEILFQQYCSICHGANAKGNIAFGAPNLTDDIWLHSNKIQDIQSIILNGRNSIMPAHNELLSDDEIHLLSAYVYGLKQ